MEIDVVSIAVGAVMAKAGEDTVGVLTAPVRAVGEHWKDRIRERLQRHNNEVGVVAGGQPLQASDRIRVKAAVEAALTDDSITHRYLAGVVASSTTEDLGTAVVGQIARLSARDLRLHYIVYRELNRLLNEPSAPFLHNVNSDLDVGRNLELFIALDELSASMGLAGPPDGPLALLASLRNLAREFLVAPFGGHGANYGPQPEGFAVGSAHELANRVRDRQFPGPGVVIRPSVAGMTFMTWGVGAEDHAPASFRTIRDIAPVDPPIPPCPSAVLVRALQRI